MKQYIIRRLLMVIPTVLLVSILIFTLLNLMPGDPASALIPPDAGVAQLKALQEKFGLNVPAPIRYFNWLKEVLKGNLGYSYFTRRPVTEIIGSRLIPTLELVGAALLISTVLGLLLGIISALKQYSFVDHLLTFFGFIWISTPGFFFGLIGIYIFGIQMDILPIGGRTPIGEITFLARLKHLILPATVLGLSMIAALMRYTRSSMLEALNQPYITTAFSKGEPKSYVYLVHAFRNASIPILIVLVFRIIGLVGGAIIIENVFSWPGMGTLMVQAITNRDYPVVLGVLMIITVVVVLVSLLVDFVTAIVDPRVRFD